MREPAVGIEIGERVDDGYVSSFHPSSEERARSGALSPSREP
jgi:hypothetical protein